jgi:hypothetical protein
MNFYKKLPEKKKASLVTKLGEKKCSFDSPKFYEDFLKDWNTLRERHEGQKEILAAFFDRNCKALFVRVGRKGAKTATNIEIAWRYSCLMPKATTYICLPTITQAIEVYWDERRLQQCDIADPWMEDKYISHINNNTHTITFVNGSKIKLCGTWSEARGRGTQPDLMIVDEVQDASADYLDAVEPNLAAKPDARLVMSGTPPRKKNHYHVWETRISKNPDGFNAKYSSYINTALPHLKGWLDNKKIELIEAGKEDVWLREYMAEDSFRSDDRVLPDVQIKDFDELIQFLKSVDATVYQPIFALVVTEHHITASYNLMIHSKYTGSKIYTMEATHNNRIWDRSYCNLYDDMKLKMSEYSRIFPKAWRQIVYDETESFTDVISGIGQSRKDLKWTKRGIPLMKEMILSGKLTFSTKAAQIGVECQNLLKEDDIRDYPTICTMAMLVNEYYQPPNLNRLEQEHWDKFAALREAGIITPPMKKRGLRIYGR